MILTALHGRELLPEEGGWEYNVLKRNGMRWIGGTCFKTYEDKRKEYAEDKPYKWAPINFPLQVPLIADIRSGEGFLWFHHHTPGHKALHFGKELRRLDETFNLFLVFTIPTHEAELLINAFKYTLGPDRVKALYLCLRNFSINPCCEGDNQYGIWYDRERERRFFNKLTEKTFFVVRDPEVVESERILKERTGSTASPSDPFIKEMLLKTEDEAVSLCNKIPNIQNAEVIYSSEIFQSIVAEGRKLDLDFMKGVEL